MSAENVGDGIAISDTKIVGASHLQDSPPSLNEEKSSEEDGVRSCNSSPLLDTAPLPTSDDPLCPYCAKPFRKPRVLDCLHSMCEDCIIAQIGDGEVSRNPNLVSVTDCMLENTSQLRPTPPGMIRCPVCCQGEKSLIFGSRLMRLYNESHVGNDERFVSQMLLDYVRLHSNENAKDSNRSCQACKSEQPAVAICKECSSDLCKNCVQAHRDMKLFDGHHVYTYDELSSQCVDLPREPVTCAKHLLVPCTTLCATCEVLICQYCQPEHSDGHSLVNVDETVSKLVKDELVSAANSASCKAKEGEEVCSSIPNQQQALLDQYEGAMNIIEDLFSDMLCAVNEVKAKVIKDLNSERDASEGKLEDYSRRLHATIAKIADAVAFTNRLVEQGSGLEVLASRRKVLQQLTLLMHSMPDMNSTIQLTFERPSYKDIVENLYKSVGNVARQDPFVSGKNEALINSTKDIYIKNAKQLQSMAVTTSNAALKSMRRNAEFQLTSLPNINIGFKPTSGPGAIGMERRQKSGTLSRNSSCADFSNGWASTALPPPEPPTPSPPMDITSSHSTGNSGASSAYNWPLSSNSSVMNDTSLIRPLASPLRNNTAISSYILAQQLATKMNVLAVQNSGNPWPGSQCAAGAQPPAANFVPTLRQRQSFPSLCDHLGDNNGCLIPSSSNVFDPLMSSLGRQSQCTTPSEQVPLAQNMLQERQLLSTGIATTWRSNAKNNAAASDLHLRWQVGGLGSGPSQFHTPSGFCLGLNNEILVADTNNHRIQVVSKSGNVLVSFGVPGVEEGHLFYPKKVVAYRSYFNQGYIILDKGDGKARLQLFSKNGEFLRRIVEHFTRYLVAPYFEQVAAIVVNESAQVVIFSSGSIMFVLDIEQESASVLKWADCSKHLSEPSDVAVYERLYYVTDYKQHRIVVFNIEGEVVRQFGSKEVTPYPIGIAISKEGDVLVADSHGNHFHILAFSRSGQRVQDFECSQIKATALLVSRCVGVRITSEGWVVSLSKHNHNVLLFDTLYLDHLHYWSQSTTANEL
uniref:B box-type domain-containing protein n=1 Tax=Syphacia muris TaxID=451379 RepID=A0A0N5B0T7_9BILA